MEFTPIRKYCTYLGELRNVSTSLAFVAVFPPGLNAKLLRSIPTSVKNEDLGCWPPSPSQGGLSGLFAIVQKGLRSQAQLRKENTANRKSQTAQHRKTMTAKHRKLLKIAYRKSQKIPCLLKNIVLRIYFLDQRGQKDSRSPDLGSLPGRRKPFFPTFEDKFAIYDLRSSPQINLRKAKSANRKSQKQQERNRKRKRKTNIATLRSAKIYDRKQPWGL